MDVNEKDFLFEGGDINAKATLDNKHFEFKVSSHALSFASPVWKKFIHPPFAQLHEDSEPIDSPAEKRNKSNGPEFEHTLDFTEDRIDALLILLQIAHLQFTAIPKSLPYETLHGVAVLCDQYDCRKLVKPWLEDWLRQDFNESNVRGQEGYLFISWCFGRHDIFSSLAMTCVLQSTIGDGGNCMIDGGFHYPLLTGKNASGVRLKAYQLEKDGILLPLDIVESILVTRHKAIEQILAAVYGVVNGYLRTKKPGKNLDETICSFRCDSANLGFLIKALNERNLWLPKSPDDIRVSIHDFVRCFYRIDKSTYRKPSCSYYDSDSSDDESHTNCYTSLSSVVTSALSSVPTPVSASHTAHMDAAVLEVGCLD